MFVAAFLVAAMPSVGVTGDEDGAPRLARWLAARKVERERVAALATGGVADGAAYAEPPSVVSREFR